MKSGFLLTINDHVHVQAQWPQLNVFRASNNLATYRTLTINEFCSGYLTFVRDNLNCDKPDLHVARDDLNYLGQLMDEIPLFGWENVRTAHGEVLRMVEQARLKWADKAARTEQLTKALRRAQLEDGEDDEAQLAPPPPPKPTRVKKPCPKYQTNECEEKATHLLDDISWLHCCAICWRVKKQKYSHSKQDCNRSKAMQSKSAAPKN